MTIHSSPSLCGHGRYKAVIDVARALVYLHTECEERIIHRDVKAANVMFDAKFNARLGDFGSVCSYNHSLLAPESTNVAGTFGYLAPELYYTGMEIKFSSTNLIFNKLGISHVMLSRKSIHFISFVPSTERDMYQSKNVYLLLLVSPRI